MFNFICNRPAQPGTGTYTYNKDRVVSLVAAPDTGFNFFNWSGDNATIANPRWASTNITMSDNYIIQANFELDLSRCFIATAAYGTPAAEQINILREFRDKVLLPSKAGSAFVTFYYRISPPIADFISRHEALRITVKNVFIEPLVAIVRCSQRLCNW